MRIVLLLSFFISLNASAAFEEIERIPLALRKEASTIQLNSGTSLMIHQFLEKNKDAFKHTKDSDFIVEFHCTKVKKEDVCTMIDLESLSINKRISE